MRIAIKKTIAGTEYWDNVEKRIIFLPVGHRPDFVVTVDPETMIHKEEVKADDEDRADTLEEMTIKQLKEYAIALEIELPKEVNNKADIIKEIEGQSAVTVADE